MNQEIKEMWVAALRSGEYEQGRRQLCSIDGKMCCLGVLSDLYIKITGQAKWADDGTTFLWDNGEEKLVLPDPVRAWAGLASNNPMVGSHTLSTYNDGVNAAGVRPHSFADIADLIERYL